MIELTEVREQLQRVQAERDKAELAVWMLEIHIPRDTVPKRTLDTVNDVLRARDRRGDGAA